jgi:novel protein kinase C epsilon type
VQLRTELERARLANKNLNEYWEWKMEYCEKEKEILLIRNEELQKELEAVNTNVSVQNLQLVGCSSQPQEGRQCGIITADDGKVTSDNFHFIKMLGEGAFGTVVLTRGKLPGGPEQLYAMKAVRKRGITSSNICDITAEKEALVFTAGHPYITTLYSCFQNKDHLFFVMEYMSGGDLMAQLEEVGVFSEERAKFYTAEITLAIQFLHQNGILHRDLKLENVLVGSDGHCKIADFGLCKLGMFRPCRTSTYVGTPYCIAPEIVKNLPYGHAVDWWAVGVMLFVMLTGELPFYSHNYEELNQKILHDEVDIPDDMSPAAVLIVLKLLRKDPERRLGSDSDNTVRQHPFFKGIDWEALEEKRVKPPENIAKIGRGWLEVE